MLKEIVFSGSLSQLPAATDVRAVVDLGANTGLSYRWLRARYPSARFVCVEPEPGNVQTLRANAGEDCQVVAACIGARERTVRLHSAIGEWGFRMVDGAGDVPVVTMHQVLEEAGIDHIDVLKCDIEGAERELFQDCRSWIGRVASMIVECHLDALNAQRLTALLAANGAEFELTHLEPNHQWGFELATFRRRGSLHLSTRATADMDECRE